MKMVCISIHVQIVLNVIFLFFCRFESLFLFLIFILSFFLCLFFFYIYFSCVFICTYTDIVEPSLELFPEDSSVRMQSIRGRKGWGDRSVGHVLAAIDERRTLPFHRLHHLFLLHFIHSCILLFILLNIRFYILLFIMHSFYLFYFI